MYKRYQMGTELNNQYIVCVHTFCKTLKFNDLI